MPQSIDPRVVIGVIAALLVVAFLSNPRNRLWYGPGAEPEIMSFEPEDAEMNSAMEKARADLAPFLKALSQPSSTRDHLAIKVGFSDDYGNEYLWLSDVRYQDGIFRGTVSNQPETVKSTYYGASVSVPAQQIADWMFIENGRLVGGYTMRVMRGRLSNEERAEFDANIGFVID
jgi:uncharacterized protein YegJ (DUF2314 family)